MFEGTVVVLSVDMVEVTLLVVAMIEVTVVVLLLENMVEVTAVVKLSSDKPEMSDQLVAKVFNIKCRSLT